MLSEKFEWISSEIENQKPEKLAFLSEDGRILDVDGRQVFSGVKETTVNLIWIGGRLYWLP